MQEAVVGDQVYVEAPRQANQINNSARPRGPNPKIFKEQTVFDQLAQRIDVKAEPIEDEEQGEYCNSCYLIYKPDDFFALKCGHKFCLNCNRDHLTTKVN